MYTCVCMVYECIGVSAREKLTVVAQAAAG